MVPGKRGRPPRDAAPRIFVRRGAYAADLRRWEAGRPTLRDPDAPAWPNGGDVTSDPEVAVRWALAYVDHFREEDRRRQLKLGPAPKLLGVSADAWIEKRKLTQPTTTCQGNRSALNALRRFAAGDAQSGRKGDLLRTDRLNHAFIQRFVDDLVSQGYAVNTLVSYTQAISGFLQYLGHGDRNAAIQARLPSEAHEEVETWTDEQLQDIRDAAAKLADSRRWYERIPIIIEFALASGLRRNELFAVDWQRIDQETRTVRVVHQLDKAERGKLVPTKSGKPRTALVLPSWWDHHQPGARGLMAPDPNGGPMSPRQPTKLLRRVLLEAGIDQPGFGWHTFRHTYARNFIVGVRGDFGLLQKSMGHASITTTERLYSHFHDDVAAGLARARIYPEERLRAL